MKLTETQKNCLYCHEATQLGTSYKFMELVFEIEMGELN